MYVVQYFASGPSMKLGPSKELGPSVEDIKHIVGQKYIAEVQSRPTTLKKIHLYKRAKKIGGHC